MEYSKLKSSGFFFEKLYLHRIQMANVKSTSSDNIFFSKLKKDLDFSIQSSRKTNRKLSFVK